MTLGEKTKAMYDLMDIGFKLWGVSLYIKMAERYQLLGPEY